MDKAEEFRSDRLGYEEIKETLEAILKKYGFGEEQADICSWLFTETTLDGIYSHGLNRFPLFIEYLKKGFVNPASEPSLIRAVNNFESWDGNLGPGNLNARFCMGRAIQMAKEQGTGIVSIRNTNHWMRGGSYGIQAAKENCMGICMTNTIPNMPPWGGRKTSIGNNPFIIAVPKDPYPILLDMAMSQFSFGKMEIMKQQGEKLPQNGGFNSEFELTNEPSDILESGSALPMGFWKGSGLSIMIDVLVSVLSGGLTSSEIGRLDNEYSISQLFIAFDLEQLSDRDNKDRIIKLVVDSVNCSDPVHTGGKVYYPGQQTWERRLENQKSGIPVSKETWENISRL